MAVPALQALTTATTSLTQKEYDALIRESEQLRILKNFIALERVLCKSEIETLIKAMEEQTNE